MSYYQLWCQRHRKFFCVLTMAKKISPNTWQMMTFLNPLDALIPNIPFSFFADFWVWVTSEARGVSLVRILGCPVH